jgi:hypothetical protein
MLGLPFDPFIKNDEKSTEKARRSVSRGGQKRATC